MRRVDDVKDRVDPSVWDWLVMSDDAKMEIWEKYGEMPEPHGKAEKAEKSSAVIQYSQKLHQIKLKLQADNLRFRLISEEVIQWRLLLRLPCFLTQVSASAQFKIPELCKT